MAKGTLYFLFFLALSATLFLGINIGKKISSSQLPITNYQSPTTPPSPSSTIYISPTLTASPNATMKQSTGVTTFTDSTCSFTFSYPGSFIRQKSVNNQSVILADPDDDTNVVIAAACAKSIPRPPVTSDKIEAIMLDKAAATLYHDQNQQDSSPRDVVIVKHPANDMEIILAGFGPNFQSVLSSFRFVK